MYVIAFTIGIFGYVIFFIGLTQLLYRQVLVGFTVIVLLFLLIYFKASIMTTFKILKKTNHKQISLFMLSLCMLLAFQAGINFIGALGPELAFDALWYHLTLPRIYIENHAVSFIPGNLLYYSAMPKQIEMIYTAALAIQGEELAKLVHFFFGLLTCVALFRLSKSYIQKPLAMLVVLIFYANLVVSWESITAYIDLGRTFFELMAFLAFIEWMKRRSLRWLFLSAMLLGFAVASKLLALGSVCIFLVLLLYIHLREHTSDWKYLIFQYVIFSSGIILVIAPWVLFSYVHTGNPVYPFFTDLYQITPNPSFINPIEFLQTVFTIFLRSADPISPIYLLTLPVLLMIMSKLSFKEKIVAFYCFCAFVIWYVTPRTGGGRFLLPYLPVFSLLVGIVISRIEKDHAFIKNSIIVMAIFISIISIGYRGFANAKYIPVILGLQSKEEFLTKNLNFSFGDFYDTDQYFSRHITKSDRVLLYGFHNLYYVNFPFVHESWIKKGDSFNYIAVQNGELPKKFTGWNLVYKNTVTDVKLYKGDVAKWE